MRDSHPIEQEVGMRYFVSDADGIGGRLRDSPADFRVRELEQFDTESVDSDPGAYPHLVCRVILRDWDTNDFARVLSDRLGISRERISWAGTKDKRAVTTQLVSIKGINPEDLPEMSGVQLTVIGRAGRPVLFGDLLGNEFQVTVADAIHPDRAAKISEQLASFAGTSEPTIGVPNFFGHQRFGSYRPITHEVGLALARSDFADAVLAYLGNPSEREPAETREARAYVADTWDWAGALERFPSHLDFERAMLHRLVNGDDEPEDFRGALESVPTNLQQLFVHAGQSYIYNLILSKRHDLGLPFHEPVPGDIVCFLDDTGKIPVPNPDRLQAVTEERLDVVRRHCQRGRAIVTAPLIGTETNYATGTPGEIERSILADLGISPMDFNLPGEFHSEGIRRAIMVRTDISIDPNPLSFTFVLPKGAYATVLLREYLKTDPSEL